MINHYPTSLDAKTDKLTRVTLSLQKDEICLLMGSKSRTQIQAVSPFRADLLDFIDEGIKSLVSIIVKNGHLLMYSCEGHKLSKPRYLVFAFTSLRSRELFLEKLPEESTLQHYSYVYLETLTEEIINDELVTHGSRQNEISGCNYLFNKNEDFYCFVRIVIGYEFSDNLFFRQKGFCVPLKKMITKLKVIVLNLLFRKVETKNFEKYFH